MITNNCSFMQAEMLEEEEAKAKVWQDSIQEPAATCTQTYYQTHYYPAPWDDYCDCDRRCPRCGKLKRSIWGSYPHYNSGTTWVYPNTNPSPLQTTIYGGGGLQGGSSALR